MSETNALALSSANNALQGGMGFEDSGGALQPVYLTLKQPTTEGLEDVRAGHFVDKASGQTWPGTVKLVPLAIRTKRVKYPSDTFVRGEKALCRSANGLVPITSSQNLIPQAPNCDVCSHASWNGYDRNKKTGKKPTCSKYMELLFVEFDTQLPFIVELKGKSFAGGKALQDALKRQAHIIKAKTGRMPNLFDFAAEMQSFKGQDGPYFSIKFPKAYLLKPEDAAAFGPIYEAVVLRAKAAQDEAATDDLAGEELGVEDGVEQI